MKPGWRTSEFWTTVAAVVGTAATLVFGPGNVPGNVQAVVAAVGGLVVAVYGAGRVTLKTAAAGAGGAQAPAVSATPQTYQLVPISPPTGG